MKDGAERAVRSLAHGGALSADPDRWAFLARVERLVGAGFGALAWRMWDQESPATVCVFLPGRAPVAVPVAAVPSILDAYGVLVAIPWRSR